MAFLRLFSAHSVFFSLLWLIKNYIQFIISPFSNILLSAFLWFDGNVRNRKHIKDFLRYAFELLFSIYPML